MKLLTKIKMILSNSFSQINPKYINLFHIFKNRGGGINNQRTKGKYTPTPTAKTTPMIQKIVGMETFGG